VIGNKLDLLKDKKELEKVLNTHYKEDLPLIVASAKNNQNIEEVFELLVYSYLKEIEAKSGGGQLNNIAELFLKTIGKTEADLNDLFFNKKKLPSIKIARERQTTVKTKTIPAHKTDEAKLKQYQALKRKITKLEMIKNEIVQEFKKNLNVVEELILGLKKIPIEDLSSTIDNTADQLLHMRSDFELSLESLTKLDQKPDTSNSDDSAGKIVKTVAKKQEKEDDEIKIIYD